MKQIIKGLLSKMGWELRRIQAIPELSVIEHIADNSGTASILNRSSMMQGLKWLADQKFEIQTVLDVGASNGCWSKECMSFLPNATYILFEPQPYHSHDLDEFVRSCNQKIIAIKSAVGASEGHTFFDASSPFGGALALDESERTIKVPLTTIDATVSKLDVKEPYLLKLDTHGFEKSILLGASTTLEKCSALIIEAYNYRISEEALLFWELCSFLSDRGFTPVDLVDVLHRDYDNSLWQMDIFFIKSNWQGFNYISYD